MTPQRCEMSVDLPQPFGPTSPKTAPLGTVRPTPSSAGVPSKTFRRFLTSMADVITPRLPDSLPKLRGRHAQGLELLDKLVEPLK